MVDVGRPGAGGSALVFIRGSAVITQTGIKLLAAHKMA